jgi:hypothetical protein
VNSSDSSIYSLHRLMTLSTTAISSVYFRRSMVELRWVSSSLWAHPIAGFSSISSTLTLEIKQTRTKCTIIKTLHTLTTD